MVALKEITWEEASAPGFETTTRQAWRSAVAEVAAKAKQTLPECHGRVDSAVKIVLAGDVELLADGKAKIASQSNGTTQYFVVNGTCECKDFPKAPSGWCKHRIAAGMQKRAAALVQRQLHGASTGQAEALSPPVPAPPDAPPAPQAAAAAPTQPAVPPAPLPEAPASVNVHLELAGRQVQLTLRDSDEGRLLARLDAVLQRFPLVVTPTSMQAPAGQDRGERPGWCAKHGIQMTQNHKDGRSWWSHKTADGWCKGR
jgi:hypothetical protein